MIRHNSLLESIKRGGPSLSYFRLDEWGGGGIVVVTEFEKWDQEPKTPTRNSSQSKTQKLSFLPRLLAVPQVVDST